MTDEVVSLKNVQKWLGEKKVLTDIDFNVSKGQHYVVLGLNGSGKTTLLRIATGMIWPTEGQVCLFGRRLGSFDIRSVKRDIGWVSSFMNMRIPISQTLLELVLSGRYGSYGLYDHPTEENIDRAHQLIRDWGLDGFEGYEFQWLSQGEKQKALIARALMPEPKLLILDEPCVGLDMKSREEFLKHISRLCNAGPTIVYVTHHIEEILPEFTDALLLKKGMKLACGRIAETVNTVNIRKCFDIDAEVNISDGRYMLGLNDG
ncbi:MAG: ATP-binding cassette domain-containing protein [Candidatus Altiarchaeota archaeon]|nr:ATP-binding cassette domain-containing protein [Candidatus Altiarchaeota archaeon]